VSDQRREPDWPDSQRLRGHVQMPSVENAIKEKYRAVISKTDMHEVSEDLRRIAAEAGLGVAVLVAWQHGLKIGCIPLAHDAHGTAADAQSRVITASYGCPYVFVHVPVRQIRRDKLKLAERGILNQNADPIWFIYHEDGLIGTFSFENPGSVRLTDADIRKILDSLAQQGVLMLANVNNRQIQFKDLVARRRIEESGEKVYVRVENRPLDRSITLETELDREDVRDYVVKTLQFRTACNYCSVEALSPQQVTIHSSHVFAHARRREDDLATVRNYQLGFTFAPFGDPRDVCHFVAWDFPHINDLVMNMEPQAYSFSDLIRLVRVINRDIGKFCSISEVDPVPEPLSGTCNHWAGNSIYHQHYQFVRIKGLPLVRAFKASKSLVTYRGVEVRKVVAPWPSPALLITSLTSGGDENVMRVADRVAREWHRLSEGEDWSYGNGIAIADHTQNTFVTTDRDRIVAIFIPRHRRKISTSDPANQVQKTNAAVLEMMGYFIIDDPDDFGKLEGMSPDARKILGTSWLSELAPDVETIQEFEANIRICLSEVVTPHEERIDEIFSDTLAGSGQEARTVAAAIRRDGRLGPEQREHLYRELLSAVLDAGAGTSTQKSSDLSQVLIVFRGADRLRRPAWPGRHWTCLVVRRPGLRAEPAAGIPCGGAGCSRSAAWLPVPAGIRWSARASVPRAGSAASIRPWQCRPRWRACSRTGWRPARRSTSPAAGHWAGRGRSTGSGASSGQDRQAGRAGRRLRPRRTRR